MMNAAIIEKKVSILCRKKNNCGGQEKNLTSDECSDHRKRNVNAL